MTAGREGVEFLGFQNASRGERMTVSQLVLQTLLYVHVLPRRLDGAYGMWYLPATHLYT